MNEQQQWWLRLGLLSELIGQAPGKLGRTALMKLAYLLQTVKGVPLGYDFRLYTYGPFDSDVLNDLGLAESLGAVKSEMVAFPSGSGYGYEFTQGPERNAVQQRIGNELSKYRSEIRWAVHEFGEQSAGDLELLTTIIYADREVARAGAAISFQDLGRSVKEIKPRFTDQYILHKIRELAGKSLLVGGKERT